MDFLKKYWAKLIIIAIAIAGAVMLIIPVFVAANIEFFGLCQSIGIVLFFVTLVTRLCLKMSEKTKATAKYVLLCGSALVLLFMSLGLVGFCADKDEAEGAMGNAYAIYKSIPDDIKAGKEKIAGLTAMTDAFSAAAAQMGAGALTTDLATFKLAGTQQATLVAGFVSSGLGAETMTVAQAATVTGTAKAIAESQLPENIDETEKDAKAGAMTVLFIYVSMMFAFGCIPLVKGIKKSFFSEDK